MNEGYENPIKTWCNRCKHWDGDEECLAPENLKPDKYGEMRPVEKAAVLNAHNLCTLYERCHGRKD